MLCCWLSWRCMCGTRADDSHHGTCLHCRWIVLWKEGRAANVSVTDAACREAEAQHSGRFDGLCTARYKNVFHGFAAEVQATACPCSAAGHCILPLPSLPAWACCHKWLQQAGSRCPLRSLREHTCCRVLRSSHSSSWRPFCSRMRGMWPACMRTQR